jgi:hypothetical protein
VWFQMELLKTLWTEPPDGRPYDDTAGPARRVGAGRQSQLPARRPTPAQPGAHGRRGHRLIGAGPYERSEERTNSRNGYREREWDTRVGTIELQIPKLHQGTYFPSLLEPRRRHERALLSVVPQAYVHGVNTRAVDQLAEALGIKGISKDPNSTATRA